MDVIPYHPEGFTTGGKKLMGRQAAGASFIRAYAEYWPGPAAALASGAEQRAHFEGVMGEAAPGRETRVFDSLPSAIAGGARSLFMFGGPDLRRQSWLRRRRGDASISLCALTHTTASLRVMEEIFHSPFAPLHDWDGLICTSQSVRDSMEALLGEAREFARWRFGEAAPTGPRLITAPLGVHVEDFRPDPQARAALRQQIGAADEDIVVVSVSRLAFHAKYHPAPLMAALQAARSAAPGRVHMLFCGWFANDGQKRVFTEAAKAFAPHVPAHVIDGRDPVRAAAARAAGDVCTLLSDNIQETFGLAPLEGMAGGKPVVGTDWDGLRDTISEDCGFRVPTLGPPPGSLEALGDAHLDGGLTYDRYIGAASLTAAFDIDAAASAFARLFADPELRARLGAAGLERARREFDWSVVTPRYVEIIDALDGARQAASLSPGGPGLSQDPSRLFAAYPSALITPKTRLAPRGGSTPSATMLRDIGYGLVPREEEVKPLIPSLHAALHEAGETRLETLAEGFQPDQAEAIALAALWLVKFGFASLPGEG